MPQAEIGITSDGKVRICVVVLVLVSLLLYSFTLRNSFVSDAEIVILQDATITDFKYLPSYFTEDSFKQTKEDYGKFHSLKYYRPLVRTLYLLEYKAFGTNPAGYNAVNISLNAFVVVLCFFLVLGITGNIQVAFVASLLYAVNPSRAEVVSWAYAVSNILMALFCLFSLILYHRGKFLISLTCFAAALLTRESSILLPFILILYEFFIKGQRSPKSYSKIVYFLIIAGTYLLVRQLVVGSPPLTSMDFVTLFNTIAVIIKRYVKIFFLPDAPVTSYQLTLFRTIDTEVLISYVVLLGLLLTGAFMWLKKRDYFFWYIWFFVWLATSFNVGRFAHFMMAETELYVASVGFCVLVASFILNLRVKKTMITFLITGIIIGHFGIAFSRSLYWKDPITYFEKLLEFAPDFYLPHYNLANKYVSKGEYEKAMVHFEKTITLNPEITMAYNNIGNIYYLKGEVGNAVSAWEKSIETDPDNPQPYFNIGFALEKGGDFRRSLYYYRKYMSLASQPPPDLVTHINELEKLSQ